MSVYLLWHGDDEPNMGSCKHLRGVYATRDLAEAAVGESDPWAPREGHTLRADDYDYAHCCWLSVEEVAA